MSILFKQKSEMSLLYVVCAIASLSATIAFKSDKLQRNEVHITADNIFVGTFRTRVDHFRAQDGRTVDFTYHANLDFFQEGGPVYIYLKSGGDYSTRWIESGLMVDIARQNNGSIFTFDYRYFGNNRPTPTTSFEDLQYLTPEQCLSDIAQFVTAIQLLHSTYGSNVIVYGAGYGGTYATWARKKYPHLISAALSSSGIFELTVATLSIYDGLAYSIYREGGINCRNIIQEAFEEAEQLIIDDNADQLQELFNLCRPVDTNIPNEVSAFFQEFYDFLVSYVQLNHAGGIQNMCDDLEGSAFGNLETFARWVNHVYGSDECFEASYASRIEERSNITWDQPGTLTGRRQWHYVQCTQLALFPITDRWTWLPNYVELTFYATKCMDILGEEYQFDLIRASLENLRNRYGSLYLRSSRTIFTNGEIDPRLYNGIIYTNDPESVALNIEQHGRASDMPSIDASDSAQLQQVKEEIIERIGNFSRPIWTRV